MVVLLFLVIWIFFFLIKFVGFVEDDLYWEWIIRGECVNKNNGKLDKEFFLLRKMFKLEYVYNLRYILGSDFKLIFWFRNFRKGYVYKVVG